MKVTRMQAALIWLAAANLISFALFGWDKHLAKREKWRVPERTLFLWALLGGAPGAIFGMRLFRHKTKHKSFTIGIPLILAAQALLVIWLWMRGGKLF